MDLAGETSMLLPKGIVKNDEKVYEEVAAFDVVPIEKIIQYWGVYTSTAKLLKDPTARRLEHFWWHVWGSNLRFLSGPQLSDRYREISNGPTFKPLESETSSLEGPSMRHFAAALEQMQATDQLEQHSPLNVDMSHRAMLSSDPNIKSLSSSASKPPPAHPILKREGAPSSTGRRPTARFVSPQQSLDESANLIDLAQPESAPAPDLPSSASVSTNGHTKSPLTGTTPTKKKAQGGKKFVASHSRRRPMMPPRARSSQASVTKDIGSVGTGGGASSMDSRTSNSTQASNGIAKVKGAETPTSVRSQGSDGLEMAAPSAKALGKRPVYQRAHTTGSSLGRRKKGTTTPTEERMAALTPIDKADTEDTLSNAESRSSPKQSETSVPAQPTERKRSPDAQSTTSDQRPTMSALQSVPMGRSRSHNSTGYNHFRQNSSSGAMPGLLRTGPSTSTTNIAAQGMIIDQSGVGSLPPLSSSFYGAENRPLHSQHGSTASFHEARLTPTQPSAHASMPLGRTKSQLTLLLERDQAKGNGKSRSQY